MSLSKEIFDIWEENTADSWEQILRNPLFLETLGHNLEIWLSLQSAFKNILQANWRTWGFPTSSDQERALYRLNQLAIQVEELSRRIDRLSAGDSPLC